MLSCWSPDASDRPTFQHLAESLEALLERESGYLKLAEAFKLKGEIIPSPEVLILKSLSFKVNLKWSMRTLEDNSHDLL